MENKTWTAYSAEADITFIMEENENSLEVNGWYCGEPNDDATKAYRGKNKAEYSTEEKIMKKINKHYFDFLTAEIVSVEDLLQQYLTDGNTCMEKTFGEYLQELLDEDLRELENALQFFNDLLEDNTYLWKKACESMRIDPTSAKGIRLWYNEYEENFADNEKYVRDIEIQILEDKEEE